MPTPAQLLVVDPDPNDEIAFILGISALTVKNHLQRICKLLGVRNRTEAVAAGSATHIA